MKLTHILIGIFFILLALSWLFPKKIPQKTDNDLEMMLELDRLKAQIQELNRDYAKQIYIIDTIYHSNDVHEYISDFEKRTGGELPPRHGMP